MECSKYILVFLLVLTPIVIGAPYIEDDEYDDDPELPDRKETMKEKQKEQEEQASSEVQKWQEEQASNEISAEFSSTTPPTTSSTTSLPIQLIQHTNQQRWVHAKDVRGYHILSDGPTIQTEYVKTRPMLRIRVNIPDTVRDVEKTVKKHTLELKIRNWNRVHKVHIKVPFGYEPEDLKVQELRDHISIVAPLYSDVDETEATFD